jgi:hypothetical protein
LEVKGCCWEFCFELNDITSQLWDLDLIEARSEEILNIEVMWNSISFLKRGETQNSIPNEGTMKR